MAVKDGSGPRPVAQSAKRHFLNRLETSFKLQSKSNSKPSICSPSCTAGCHLACFRLAQLGSKGGATELKHHGSEGRIGPAARSPERQTSLSKLASNLQSKSNSKPSICSPSCTAGCHLACFRPAQLGSKGGAAELKHAKTPWQWRTDRARGP